MGCWFHQKFIKNIFNNRLLHIGVALVLFVVSSQIMADHRPGHPKQVYGSVPQTSIADPDSINSRRSGRRSNPVTPTPTPEKEPEPFPTSSAESTIEPPAVELVVEEPVIEEPPPVQIAEPEFVPEPEISSTSTNVADVTDSTATNDLEPLAVKWYREKAKAGDVDAQFNLGMVLETGFGVKPSPEQAIEWYSEAAAQGHPEAQLKLGMLYFVGQGADESNIKGGKWIRSSAQADNAFARLLRDKILTNDIGGLDIKDTISQIRTVYNKKNPDAATDELLEIIARAEIKNKNPRKKTRFTSGVTGSGAKAGSVGNTVPDFLADTQVEKQIVGNSLATVRRHAKDGIPDAQYEWARMLQIGRQVPTDKPQAIKWYSSAASQGHASAQYRLAVAYLYGEGVKKNIRKGTEFLLQSAKSNHVVALKLQNYLSPGKNRMININSSITLPWHLEAAVENNDGDAMLSLGYMFRNGWGVVRNPKEGEKWLRKARVAGAKGASNQLRIIKVDDANKKELQEGRFGTLPAPQPAPVRNQQQRSSEPTVRPVARDQKSLPAEQEQSNTRIVSNVKELIARVNDGDKNPIILLVAGIVFGFVVFKLMRRSDKGRRRSAY